MLLEDNKCYNKTEKKDSDKNISTKARMSDGIDRNYHF